MPARILITGASGCVGQYTAHWLLQNSDADLLLWLRDPSKLTAIQANNPRVRLLVGDLRETDRFASDLATVTRVIHTATAWGDPERAHQVNVVAVKRLLALLNPNLIEQITYFSTASILNRHLQPLPEALAYGTEYIQTKAQCLSDLEQHPLAEKIVAVFPTLVFGGRVDGTSPFPTSYLTEGLAEASKWLWLARFLRA
ncbi:NAD-dependent epimerase, partial [Pseudomonas sp. HMWF031]